MARSRNLKPGFFTNDVLAEVEPLGRLLFQGLWCHADREGRLHDRPKKLKVEILPYDECDLERLLNELASRGFIFRYEANENKYIQIINFSKHQNPHVKESASTIPAPDNNHTSPADSLNPLTDSLNPIKGNGADAPLLSFWDIGESFGVTRPTIGRMVKDFGEDAVSDAIRNLSLRGKRPADATAYIRGMLKNKATNVMDGVI